MGIYETYDAETVAVLDVPARTCAHPDHKKGHTVSLGGSQAPAPESDNTTGRNATK